VTDVTQVSFDAMYAKFDAKRNLRPAIDSAGTGAAVFRDAWYQALEG
jgi:hypothetical protein